MRRTRFMSLLFLVWSVAFFFLPEFREGLRGAFFARGPFEPIIWRRASARLERAAGSKEAISRAEQEHDARGLAFFAMHTPAGGAESFRLANEAIALDPHLKFILPKVFVNVRDDKAQSPADLQKVIDEMKRLDPDNALPYLYEAQEVVERRRGSFPSSLKLDDLAKETEWRMVMEKAFSAASYNSHSVELFELDRAWAWDHHLRDPETMFVILASYPIPFLFNISQYSHLLLTKLGKEAEEAGRPKDALATYWAVAHFGERMRLNDGSLLERLIGSSLQRQAYEALVPALRKAGYDDQAATVLYAHDEVMRSLDTRRGRNPFTQNSMYYWLAMLVEMFAAAVTVFAAFTVLCVVYVNLKRWVRKEKCGKLFEFLTVAENYMPILLFTACLGLYLSYYPYARNFQHYMTATGSFHDFEPFFVNSFPVPDIVPAEYSLHIGDPFESYAWYAVAGLIIGFLTQIRFRKSSP